MKHLAAWLTMGIVLGSSAGCARITTQVVEKPRLDQESAGNRGYLVGTAKEASVSRKTTRRIIQTDIELATPGELNPWKVRGKKMAASPSTAVPSPVLPQPQMEEGQEEEPATWSSPLKEPQVASRSYLVKEGDTLEKIAKKFYGTPNAWRRIYEANRDKITSPNRLYPGQELVIPETGEEGARGAGDMK